MVFTTAFTCVTLLGHVFAVFEYSIFSDSFAFSVPVILYDSTQVLKISQDRARQRTKGISRTRTCAETSSEAFSHVASCVHAETPTKSPVSSAVGWSWDIRKEMCSRSSAWVPALVLACFLPVLWAETASSTPQSTTPAPSTQTPVPGQAHVAAINTVPTLFVNILCSDGEQPERCRIPRSHPLDLDFDAINARFQRH